MYSPTGSDSIEKFPRPSVTATAIVCPNAETIAPATGPPRSSLTLPVMVPRMLRTD
jgi:hypothetical protein